jgi:molybdopterin converting factor subunit 1
MKISARLFASLREKTGTSQVVLDLAQGATVADAIQELNRLFPSLVGSAFPTMFAVNAEYVQDSHPLQDGDEMALIPPVSGGVE